MHRISIEKLADSTLLQSSFHIHMNSTKVQDSKHGQKIEREVRTRLLELHVHIQFHLNKLSSKLNGDSSFFIGSGSGSIAADPIRSSTRVTVPGGHFSKQAALFGSRSMDISHKQSFPSFQSSVASRLSSESLNSDPPLVPSRKSTKKIKTVKSFPGLFLERSSTPQNISLGDVRLRPVLVVEATPPSSPSVSPSKASIKESNPKTMPLYLPLHAPIITNPALTPNPSPPRIPKRSSSQTYRESRHSSFLPGGPIRLRSNSTTSLSTPLLLYILSHVLFTLITIIGYEKIVSFLRNL